MHHPGLYCIKKKLKNWPFFRPKRWVYPDAIGADAWSTDQLRGHYACFNRLISRKTFVSAEDLWSHNLWSAHSLGAELLRDSASNYCHWSIYFFMSLKVTSLRILHIYYIQISALCETCTNNHLGTLRQQVKKLNWNGLHVQAFWELLRQTVF